MQSTYSTIRLGRRRNLWLRVRRTTGFAEWILACFLMVKPSVLARCEKLGTQKKGHVKYKRWKILFFLFYQKTGTISCITRNHDLMLVKHS